MSYIPDQGDLVFLDFDPSSGKEIMKRRPAFVISRRTFNAHTGLAIAAPITNTIRGIQLEVVLSSGLATKGAILIHQLKSLDFINRNVQFIERAPKEIIEKTLALVQVITR